MRPRLLSAILAGCGFAIIGCAQEFGDDDTGPASDDDTGGQPDDDDTGGQPDDDDTGGQPDDDDTGGACDDHCGDGLFDCGESGVDCGGDCDPCPEVTLWSGWDGTFPTVAATADKVVVAWLAGPVMFACHDALGWAAVHEVDVGVSWGKSTRLAADPAGRIHLVVTEGGGSNIRTSVLSADPLCASATWSLAEGLADPALGGRYPNVAIDANEDPHVVWHDQDYTNVYHRKATGGVWEPVQQVTTTEWDSRYPDVAVVGTSAHVIYEQDDASYANCLPHHTAWNGSGWDAPYELVDSYHSWPQIVAESDGDVHVLYTDRYGSGEVKYRHLSGGAWGGEHGISSGPTDWTWTSLALVDDLDLHATWHQTVGGRGQVFYATGDATAGTWEVPRQVSTDGSLDNWQAAVAVDPQGVTHVAWMKVQPGTEEGQILYRAVQFGDLDP